MKETMGLILLASGLFLILHDVLYHLKIISFKIGRPLYFGEVKLHHAYFGIILVGIWLKFFS